ncbi:BCCT family transporter [Staphylococcus pseudintermedius]|uniref:BCCT family transporter n=12 Tax=Staphylococcus pseudintermedius TaxID=283734 RepID=A0A166P444_STAPS|nr:BCCT family transporter [Staphylococcus pseudintermedius]ADV05606.1 Glycine betaine transporter OpuD [Staphylococcus pseudintermedius HKU10-03]ADX76683.1 glycine betaine transporter [Staphylococcus pseudintermedius ED99]ANS89635.1 Glycine betaine transporter OpuD [Staphylococcus pseudintermedius]ASQ50700.1 choline transporter [Staphylococcus pseudintermedius]AYG56731.1 BCCT family transporter [Staphylococcus pseudintermedius]
MNSSTPEPNGKKFSPVFLVSAIIVFAIVLIGVFIPTQFGEFTNTIKLWITDKLGWYYLILTTIIVFFCIFLIFSPIGKLKLGRPNDKPEFNTVSWFAMLFSAGMGIGLVFYGAAEPISHFASPPNADPQSTEAFTESLRSTFFHWGFHAWAVYGVVALALAYAQFRKGEPGLLSKTLRPILGDHVDGLIGTIIDVLAVFATVIGVAVSLGMGALQISGGLNYLFGLPNTIVTQSIIIVVVTILFIMSAWSGLSKGIQYLSNLNIGLGTLLLITGLIVGPTVLILNMFTSSTGSLLNSFLFNSFDAAATNPQKREWMSDWTLYYWGWWLSWSPFVGVFIARVSKGRSIREFISGVLLVPVIVSFIWFSVFGVLGIETAKKHKEIFDMSAETQLFGVFNHIPLGIVLSIIALLLIASFFITSADSATFVLGMQTTNGSLNPSAFIKVTWGIAQSLIAFVLLLSGGGDGEAGLNALQSAAIISALPFSFIVILMMISFYKDANKERKFLGLTLTPNKHRLKEYVANSQQDYEDELISKRKGLREQEK